MARRIIRRMLTMLFAVLAAFLAQAPATGAYVTSREIAATLKNSIEKNIVDQPIKAVALPGGHQAAVALLRRTKAETSALIHDRVTEIYEIMEGSGTLVTGGALESPTPTDLTRVNAGPSQTGQHKGGESRRVGPKDVIIVPAGMPHRFSQLDGPITYMVYRFEPR